MATPLPERPPTANARLTVPLVCVLLAAIVLVVFGQARHDDFVNYDDDQYFSANPHVLAGLTWNGVIWAFQTHYAANWHPLTWLSLMLDAQLFGTGPHGPHLTNVVLHAANVVLLFLFLKRLTGKLWPGAFVAAVFAIHPLHVESVAWLSERKDVLSGLFFMLTLWMYVCYAGQAKAPRPKPWVFYMASLMFLAFGLMSKAMLVTVPFVLLLLDYWPLRRSFDAGSRALDWRLIREKIPFFVLSAASCVVTMYSQSEAVTSTETLPLYLRISNAMVAYVIYLGQTAWPAGLAIFYPHPESGLAWWKTGLSLAVLAGITTGAWRARRTHPCLLAGWLWYLGMLVPVIGLVQVGGQAHADRYTYLPLIGILIMLAWTVEGLTISRNYHRWVAGLAAGGVIAGLMTCAFIQVSYWRNSESLWTHALDCDPQDYVAHNGLGVVLADEGQNTEAIGHYQQALATNPDYAVAHNNLGIVLAKLGRGPEAIEHYQQALQFKPDYVEAHINLGNALAGMGRLDEATAHFQSALQLDPYSAQAHNNWGAMLLAHGRTEDAMDHFQKAIEINPNYAEVQINLGTALAEEGQADEAIKHYLKALQLKPDYAKAHYNLANILASQGHLDEAIEHYRQAVALMPDFNHARYQLGVLLESRGKFAEAVAQFQKICELDPKHIPAQNNLAWLLATCPDASLRNGSKAVELAESVRQLGGDHPETLDTLAAAYAEAGEFDKAITSAQLALNLALAQTNSALAGTIRGRLELYQSKTPFRNTAP